LCGALVALHVSVASHAVRFDHAATEHAPDLANRALDSSRRSVRLELPDSLEELCPAHESGLDLGDRLEVRETRLRLFPECSFCHGETFPQKEVFLLCKTSKIPPL
jgi:hypothetical protein